MQPKLCRRCPGVLLRSSDQLDAHDAMHAIRDARDERLRAKHPLESFLADCIGDVTGAEVTLTEPEVVYTHDVRFEDYETFAARRELEAG